MFAGVVQESPASAARIRGREVACNEGIETTNIVEIMTKAKARFFNLPKDSHPPIIYE